MSFGVRLMDRAFGQLPLCRPGFKHKIYPSPELLSLRKTLAYPKSKVSAFVQFRELFRGAFFVRIKLNDVLLLCSLFIHFEA